MSMERTWTAQFSSQLQEGVYDSSFCAVPAAASELDVMLHCFRSWSKAEHAHGHAYISLQISNMSFAFALFQGKMSLAYSFAVKHSILNRNNLIGVNSWNKYLITLVLLSWVILLTRNKELMVTQHTKNIHILDLFTRTNNRWSLFARVLRIFWNVNSLRINQSERD
jgi:hypothetical protein